MTESEKIRVCEIISLAQRIIDNARGDIKERRTESANAKLELLDLELGLHKKDYISNEEIDNITELSSVVDENIIEEI